MIIFLLAHCWSLFSNDECSIVLLRLNPAGSDSRFLAEWCVLLFLCYETWHRMLQSGKCSAVVAFVQNTVLNLQINFKRPPIHKEVLAVNPPILWDWRVSPCVADLRAEPLDFKLCILLGLLIEQACLSVFWFPLTTSNSSWISTVGGRERPLVVGWVEASHLLHPRGSHRSPVLTDGFSHVSSYGPAEVRNTNCVCYIFFNVCGLSCTWKTKRDKRIRERKFLCPLSQLPKTHISQNWAWLGQEPGFQ